MLHTISLFMAYVRGKFGGQIWGGGAVAIILIDGPHSGVGVEDVALFKIFLPVFIFNVVDLSCPVGRGVNFTVKLNASGELNFSLACETALEQPPPPPK